MKKGLTLLLTVVMVLTMSVANTSAASFADTAGTNCETAVNVLAALGIVEGKGEGAFEPDSALTRAEMATIILRAMNLEGGAAGRDIFTDVPQSHWAYANIAAAYQIGIINGTSATTFEPDKSVTYEQAVKMVVAALGYSVQADALGGYPSGYLSKATQLDILKNVAKGGEMTRGNMANLLYNALDVELFLQYTFGEEAFDFETNATKTLLSYYLKVAKYTGEITATPMAQFASAAPSRRLLSDEVLLGAQILKKGETNAQDMLGVRSDIYTRKEGDSEIPVILAIVPRANVEIIDVLAQDIEAKTSATEFVYTNADGDEEKVIIAGAKFIYNGREETITNDLIAPEIGTVRLISEGDSVDVVMVWEFENYVVENVLTTDYEVYFMGSSTPEVIDFNDNSMPTVMTDGEGNDVTLESLTKWDVLSIAKSLGHNTSRVRRIYRSNTQVTGEISEITAGVNEVVIGENTYSVALPLSISSLRLGQNAAYYLDFTGAIAAVDTSYDVSRIYGWLQNAEMTKGLNAKPQLKIFTQDGEWKVFDLAENIRFNGQGRDSASLLDAAYAEVNIWGEGVAPSIVKADGTVAPQLIAYKTNDAGVITEIETAYNKTTPTDLADVKNGGTFSMDWYVDTTGNGTGSGGKTALFDGVNADGAPGSATGGSTQKVGDIFLGKIVGGADSKVFVIPSDTTVERNFQIRTAKSVGLEEWRGLDCISFYDVDEDCNLGAMVVRNDLANAGITYDYPNEEVPYAMIIGKSTVLTEDGETKQAVKLLTSGAQTITAYMEDNGVRGLYTSANADIQSDRDWWIEKTVDGELVRVEAEDVDITNPDTFLRTYIKNKAVTPMFIDLDKLVPGDVIQYKMDSSNVLTQVRVAFRANHPGNVAFAHSLNGTQGYMGATGLNNYYIGGGLNANGVVDRILDAGILVDCYTVKTGWGGQDLPTSYLFRKGGKYLLWDREKEEGREITADEIAPKDEVFVVYNKTAILMTIVYREAKITVE